MAVRRREGIFNPKRQIASAGTLPPDQLAALRGRAVYGGNPEHKRHPADYGLGPPPNPRPGKTLCDGDGPFEKRRAAALLRAGFDKGMISRQMRGDWPQNVWAVDESGVVYEAQLENRDCGEYHGYPMPSDDPFRDFVLDAWEKR